MAHQRIQKTASWNPPTQKKSSQFAPPTFTVQAQQSSHTPPTQQEIENQAFDQNKFEAYGLQLKQKYGTITPVESERLAVLQAKMDDFWAQRMEKHKGQPNLLEILSRNAGKKPTQAALTVQPKLTIGQPNDRHEQEADQVDENPVAQLARAEGGAKSVDMKGKGDFPESSMARQTNKTGLPDHLKTGVENLSGYSLDHVRVHYNSPKPAQVQALAYTQGKDIHVASGQEAHLPHEAWHVVQQMQGRVKPTMQMKGLQMNDDQGLEREADVMGAKAIKVKSHNKQAKGKAANPVSVVQAIRSVVTFQGQTPGSLFTPRNTIKAIDTALDNYINSPGPEKLNMANALLLAIAKYLHTPNRDQARVIVVQNLQAEAQQEHNLLNELGAANGGLFDDLIQRVGGRANIGALTAVAQEITAAYAAQLPHLVTLAGGAANLGVLPGIIQNIQPANAFLLSGLIPIAGGAANLGQLDNLIQHITPAHAMLLFQLIPLANTLDDLDQLIQATGVAHVNLLVTMIPNAGGVDAVPLLTGAINWRHPGSGDLAQDLTVVAAGNLARFQELTTILPRFEQKPAPGVVPGTVQAAVDAYNAHPGGPPFNRRIGQVNFDHFLERHTHRFFDFIHQIGALNDQWPFYGPATPVSVADALVAALNDLRTRNAWIQPNVAQVVHAGGYQTSVGVKVDGAVPMPHPITGLGAIPSVTLGQFFPHPAGGGGVIPMDRAAMNAIHRLL